MGCELPMTKWADLGDMTEDQRIKIIGECAMRGEKVGVVLEKKEHDKIARYIEKITSRYPGVGVLKRFDGPTQGVVTIKFGLKPH